MNKNKLWGAIISASVLILYFGFLFILFTYASVSTGDIPLMLFIVLSLFIAFPLVGIILALVFRVKELKSGEEEEAKKYQEVNMLLVSTEEIKGKEIQESLGIVKGEVVQSKNFGRDFMAGMKTIVGGEIKGYTEMIREARQIATKRMVDEATSLGADAVVGIRYGSSAVMQGAAEIIVYGTAVKLK